MFRITQSAPSSAPATATRTEACPGAVAPTGSGEDRASDVPAQALLEAAFRSWVQGHAKADLLVVGTRDPVAVPLGPALRRLATSTKPLAPAHGAALGLADDVSIGAAAAALLQACVDPAGPRCRSYRSATYFLVGRALLELDEDADANANAAPSSPAMAI
jgi:hypothetical protein